MVQSVLLEQSKEEEIFYLLDHQLWTVGLLIGRITPSRHYISFIVKTPLPDDADDSHNIKKSSKKRKKTERQQRDTVQEVVDKIDDSWVIEHARQVTRCLPGGLSVMGLFLIAPDEMCTVLQPKMRYLTYKACETPTAVFPGTGNPHKDEGRLQGAIPTTRVFLQVSSDTKQHKCRVIDVSDQKNSFSPAELNYVTHSTGFHKIEGKMKIDTTFRLPQREISKRVLLKELKDSLRPTLRSVLEGIVAFHGCLVPHDVPLVKPSGKSPPKTETFPAILYRKSHQLDSDYDITASQSTGCVQFTGTVYAQAFVHGKATHGEAEMALKQDIFRTLLARVELLCEDLFLQREAEQELLPVEEQKTTSVIELPSSLTQWRLPVRVLATVPEIPFPLSDYSTEDEEPEDSADRICRCLDIGLDPKDINITNVEKFGVKDDSKVIDNNNLMKHQPARGAYYWRIAGAAATALVAYLIWFSQQTVTT